MSEGGDPLPPAQEELWALVEALVAGTATPEERDRLEEVLRADAPARQFYVTYLDLHAQLQWRTRGKSAPPASAEAGAKRTTPRTQRARRSPWVVAGLAVAAGLLVALLVKRHGSDEIESPDLPGAPAGSVAVLIDNRSAVWEADMALPTGTGSALPPGRLKLRAGVVEVAFHGGAEVLLEGPADLDARAPDRAFLHHGKLTAKVPEGAPAFRVALPGVVVTDLGGECGVLRDQAGVTEVHVFEGHVGADPTDGAGEPLPGIRLAENAGARVDAASRTLRPVPLNLLAFALLRPEVRLIDASVRAGQYAGCNFGTAPQLMVKNSIADYTWETYLRFDLSGIRGSVREARVRLVPVCVGRPFANAAAVVPDNQWGETTVTWGSKPAAGLAIAQWVVREGEPVEFDVTPFVQEALAADRRLSLCIFAPRRERGRSYAQYGSREGDPEARPQLLITPVP
jgi:hypothetical protein